MKNLLKLHENLVIFPLKFSQDFHGFWFHSGGPVTLSSVVFLGKTLALTVPLSTQVSTCKWVPCDRLKILSRGGGGTVCRNTSWYRNWVKLQPDGPLRSFADFYNLPTLNYHVFQLCQRVKQQPKTKTFLP